MSWYNGDRLRPEIRLFGVASILAAGFLLTAVGTATRGEKPAKPNELLALRGQVVWMAEVLESRGARSVPEAKERTLALQMESGELIPVLEDVRGRAFRADPRLRAMQAELLVRKLPQSPFVQIISVSEITPQGTFEVDYWCQICAIAMYEQKPCDCCQGETELRKRRVDEKQHRAK